MVPMSEESYGFLLPEAAEHYASGHEAERLYRSDGPLERERTREIALRHLAPAPGDILDVGGGAGVHAYWLTSLGYRVQLIDALPLHVGLALVGSKEFPGLQLESAAVGDARNLSNPDDSVDAVL